MNLTHPHPSVIPIRAKRRAGGVSDPNLGVIPTGAKRRGGIPVFVLATLLLALIPLQLHPQHQTPNAPLLGSAWYPEQWPEATWEHDLTLMQQAHFNVVRLGEFAWSSLEPTEGHYTLDWLDHAIALAAKHHLAVVLSTPTDAPPAWLTTKYPDTVGTGADGRLREHGNRRQFSYASPHYRELCARMVTQLAQHFGQNPAVLGWQIGNEYTDESFDPVTRAQFQLFLRDKYKTLASLNARWSTVYWSQSYTAWSQIPMRNSDENPALLLEHKHFVTATWRSFQKAQIDILRPRILPTQFITTNIGGLAWSDNWDHYALTADLDLAAWDEYVGQGHLDALKEAMLNDFVRGWKRQNFWLMETQPGFVNWAPINNALAPGETRALAWQAIGHGADAILYWQWRAALNGQEQYHGAIVGPDGNPLPIYAEIAQLGRDLELTRAALAGTAPHAELALLHTYDSRWAIDFQPHTRDYDQQAVLLRFYSPLQQLAQASGHAVDIIDPTQPGPLTQYKLLVAPSLNVIDEPLAAKLLAYVRAGGHLLLGPRSGMKDAFNALNPQRQPGLLADALGAKVAQFYALSQPVSIQGGSGSGTAELWAEPLTPLTPGAHIDLIYSDRGGWLDHQPAMLTRTLGQGTVAYLGTLPDADLLRTLLTTATSAVAISTTIGAIPLSNMPASVEVCTRSGLGGSVTIVINHGPSPISYPLPAPLLDLLSDHPSTTINRLELPSQGTAALIAPSPK